MIKRFVLLGVLLMLLWGSVCGQTYTLNASLNGQTITTCSGNFYDSGGPNGSYGSSQDYTVTVLGARTVPSSLSKLSAIGSTTPEQSYELPNITTVLLKVVLG